MRDSIIRSAAVVLLASGAWSGLTLAEPGPERSTTSASIRADGLAAWQQIYSVLTHPRCINCHTATNYPQQGTIGTGILPTSCAVRLAEASRRFNA